MNLTDISTQLLFTTVPIWVQKREGEIVSATAFIYNVPVPSDPQQSIPLLVTNSHVVQDAVRGQIEIYRSSGDSPNLQNRTRLEFDGETLAKFANVHLDIAATPLGPILSKADSASLFFRSIGHDQVPSADSIADLAAMEDVIFIGYPNGIRDSESGISMIRRGVTATPVWNEFEGKRVFLIDAGVFPGSSGSPVFILNQGAFPTRTGLSLGNRLVFLGMITSTLVRSERDGQVYLGLGKVLRSDVIRDYVNTVARTLLRSVP